MPSIPTATLLFKPSFLPPAAPPKSNGSAHAPLLISLSIVHHRRFPTFSVTKPAATSRVAAGSAAGDEKGAVMGEGSLGAGKRVAVRLAPVVRAENGNGEGTEAATAKGGSFDKYSGETPPRLKVLTLPTMLTIGRVAAVPIFVSTFYMDGWWATTATTSIFLLAAITDWLDGYIARKMKLGTAFGAFLDPVADKLMVAATLVLLCTRPLGIAFLGGESWLLTIPSIAVIGREITMSAVREWAASQNGKILQAVAVNNLGKWKTATQMTALTILLASRDPSLASQGVLVSSGVLLLYISACLSIWSLFVYIKNIWRVLLK